MSAIMAKEKKEVLYVELPASLKKRFVAIADANGRKLVAEAIRAIKRYVEQEEKRLEKDPSGDQDDATE